MRKSALLLLGAVALLVPAGAASAGGPPQPANGAATQSLFVASGPPRFANGNIHQDFVREGQVLGTFNGNYHQDLQTVTHLNAGRTNVHGSGFIDGQFAECGVGRVFIRVNAIFDFANPAASRVHISTKDQGDSTVGVHFNIRIEGPVPVYSGRYHCT
jgi:hypothetical protein